MSDEQSEAPQRDDWHRRYDEAQAEIARLRAKYDALYQENQRLRAGRSVSEDTIERRCNGCGHQWTGPAPVVLCGECWRKTWPFIWGGVNPDARAPSCSYGDPSCPCQDGDPCHYEDTADTTAMTPPRPEQPQARAAALAEAMSVVEQERQAWWIGTGDVPRAVDRILDRLRKL